MAEQGGASDLPTKGLQPADGRWPPEVEGIEPLEVVGSGGSGTVWKCSQPRFHRLVAVKVVDARLDRRAEALFARECRALGGLSGHPHIVPVYAGGVEQRGRPYLVMPFLETGTLADLLVRSGPLDWRTAASHLAKVSSALQAAHEAGILHRDIKPENVLLTAYGEPQLADFGIARIAGVVTTATSSISATPIHAAPEVLNGEPATERSDVYGLASSLYRLLSGNPAFYEATDESLLTLLVRIATQEPRPLTGLGVPAELADVVRRGMEKTPDVRTGSAREFGDALTGALSSAGGASPPAVATLLAVPAKALESQPPVTEPTRRGRRTWVYLLTAVVLSAGAALVWTVGGGSGGPASGAEGGSTIASAPVLTWGARQYGQGGSNLEDQSANSPNRGRTFWRVRVRTGDTITGTVTVASKNGCGTDRMELFDPSIDDTNLGSAHPTFRGGNVGALTTCNAMTESWSWGPVPYTGLATLWAGISSEAPTFSFVAKVKHASTGH